MTDPSHSPTTAARRAVGEHLRRLRLMQGWTLQEIAERVSSTGVPVSHSTISRVELGQTAITADLLVALGETLGADFSTIEEIMRVARRAPKEDLSGKTVESLFGLGMRAGIAGDYLKALECYQAARDRLLAGDRSVAEKDVDRLVADSMLYESECHRRLRQYSLSVDTAGRVLNLPNCPVDQEFRALLLHVQWGYQVGAFYQAKLYAQAAEKLIDRVEPKLHALGAGVIAAMHFKLEDWAQAAPRLDRAREQYEKLDLKIEVARLGVSLGFARHKSGDATGRDVVLESLEQARAHNFDDVVAYALRTLGRIAVERLDRKQARDHLTEAANIAQRLELVHEEFIAWYDLWKASRGVDQVRAEATTLQRRLTRMLRKIDRRLPEAQEFLKITSSASPPDETAS